MNAKATTTPKKTAPKKTAAPKSELIDEGREIIQNLSQIWGDQMDQVKADLGFISDNSSFSSFVNLATKFVVIKVGMGNNQPTVSFMNEKFLNLWALLHTQHGEFLETLVAGDEKPPEEIPENDPGTVQI